VALVIGGELRPFIGSSRVDPSGVAWSTTFAFALLLFAGIVPAMALLAGAAALSGILSRRATFRWLFNAGQYALSLMAAWAVLEAFDRAASLTALWSPRTLGDLAVVLLAAAAYFVTNELLVAGAVSALTGRTVVEDLRAVLTFEVAANGAQLALAPVVALVMHHAPALTALAVLPVAAIHRSAAAERESRHAASHDDLTDLANRKHFVSRSERALEESRRTGEPVAVLVVDLDRFKEVNDVLGHPAGDAVIVEAARRMRAAVGDADVVGRLGGDEFAVLVPAARSRQDVERVALRLREALETPFRVSGRDVDLGASIGIAMAPEHAEDFESLFTRADTAMYAAKREGTGTCFYGPELDAGAAVHLGVLGALRRALDAGHITVAYQPKVAMADHALDGVEALVRWRDEDGSFLPPDYFVPLAEQSGLMPRLTAAVLDLTLAQCAQWSRQGLRVPVSVNISLRDVLDPDFAVGLAARLVRYGVLASMLTLEITERVVTEDLSRVRATLQELSDIGVRLSIDDFGTGWSSLVLLRNLPVSEVKLDRS
ncbi:MAG: putative bifunctional diguanylate cyclase/phosphodiesterase, partial [Actinomycetota bacterium]